MFCLDLTLGKSVSVKAGVSLFLIVLSSVVFGIYFLHTIACSCFVCRGPLWISLERNPQLKDWCHASWESNSVGKQIWVCFSLISNVPFFMSLSSWCNSLDWLLTHMLKQQWLFPWFHKQSMLDKQPDRDVQTMVRLMRPCILKAISFSEARQAKGGHFSPPKCRCAWSTSASKSHVGSTAFGTWWLHAFSALHIHSQ